MSDSIEPNDIKPVRYEEAIMNTEQTIDKQEIFDTNNKKDDIVLLNSQSNEDSNQNSQSIREAQSRQPEERIQKAKDYEENQEVANSRRIENQTYFEACQLELGNKQQNEILKNDCIESIENSVISNEMTLENKKFEQPEENDDKKTITTNQIEIQHNEGENNIRINLEITANQGNDHQKIKSQERSTQDDRIQEEFENINNQPKEYMIQQINNYQNQQKSIEYEDKNDSVRDLRKENTDFGKEYKSQIDRLRDKIQVEECENEQEDIESSNSASQDQIQDYVVEDENNSNIVTELPTSDNNDLQKDKQKGENLIQLSMQQSDISQQIDLQQNMALYQKIESSLQDSFPLREQRQDEGDEEDDEDEEKEKQNEIDEVVSCDKSLIQSDHQPGNGLSTNINTNCAQKIIHNPEFLRQQQVKSDMFYEQLKRQSKLVFAKTPHQLFDQTNIISSIGQSSVNQPLQDSSQWEWMPCNFLIKQSLPHSTVVWPLEPSVSFGNPLNDNHLQIAKMTLTMEKYFTYDAELGWNWHKSWIIPAISLQFEVLDPETKESFSPPKNTFAQIYAVKASTKEIAKFHIIDIGLKGTARIPLEEATQVVFQALKFTSTSYNNEGSKFNLVVAVIVQTESSPHPRVIEAVISPPIFVDSRKSARETQIIKHVKLTSFYDLFPPENFKKRLVKRKKIENEQNEEEITNDIQGFTSYFTAPNIRNKVKHPLFLAYKFSKCMEVYYNREEFGVLNNYEQLVERVLENLLDQGKIHCQSSKTTKSKKKQNGIDKINTHALLTIVLSAFPAKSEASNNHLTQQNNKRNINQHESTEIFSANKKIAELLGPVDNSVVNIIFDKSYLPEKYKIISSIEKIRIAYEEVYEKIIKQQPQLRADRDKQEEDDEENENFSENVEGEEDENLHEESEGPRKKFKGNSIEQQHEFSSHSNSSNHMNNNSNKDPKDNQKNSHLNSTINKKKLPKLIEKNSNSSVHSCLNSKDISNKIVQDPPLELITFSKTPVNVVPIKNSVVISSPLAQTQLKSTTPSEQQQLQQSITPPLSSSQNKSEVPIQNTLNLPETQPDQPIKQPLETCSPAKSPLLPYPSKQNSQQSPQKSPGNNIPTQPKEGFKATSFALNNIISKSNSLIQKTDNLLNNNSIGFNNHNIKNIDVPSVKLKSEQTQKVPISSPLRQVVASQILHHNSNNTTAVTSPLVKIKKEKIQPSPPAAGLKPLQQQQQHHQEQQQQQQQQLQLEQMLLMQQQYQVKLQQSQQYNNSNAILQQQQQFQQQQLQQQQAQQQLQANPLMQQLLSQHNQQQQQQQFEQQQQQPFQSQLQQLLLQQQQQQQFMLQLQQQQQQQQQHKQQSQQLTQLQWPFQVTQDQTSKTNLNNLAATSGINPVQQLLLAQQQQQQQQQQQNLQQLVLKAMQSPNQPYSESKLSFPDALLAAQQAQQMMLLEQQKIQQQQQQQLANQSHFQQQPNQMANLIKMQQAMAQEQQQAYQQQQQQNTSQVQQEQLLTPSQQQQQLSFLMSQQGLLQNNPQQFAVMFQKDNNNNIIDNSNNVQQQVSQLSIPQLAALREMYARSATGGSQLP